MNALQIQCNLSKLALVYSGILSITDIIQLFHGYAGNSQIIVPR